MSDSDLTPVHDLPRLPRRAAGGHKGTYGTVLVVGGGRGMTGAAVLCGRAALRAGAGLVQVASPAAMQPVVAASYPSYTTFGIPQHADGSLGDGAAAEVVGWAKKATALAVGPGLGHAPDVAALVRGVVRELPDTPTVIDADGLNVLAPFTDEFAGRPVPLVLTPHPGEFARLVDRSTADVQASREALAVEFAARFRVVLLLKGVNTIVTDGRRVYRNTTGNPGMATGGTGDVLTGVIAALLGQRLPPFDAAVLGAWVHGRAGDLAAGDLGQTALTSADLPDYLPRVFRALETAP